MLYGAHLKFLCRNYVACSVTQAEEARKIVKNAELYCGYLTPY